jgi:hypothetical protein
MFCDLAERDAQAKEVAKGLGGGSVRTADMSFTYPIFNRSLTRTTLQHEGMNTRWDESGMAGFVSRLYSPHEAFFTSHPHRRRAIVPTIYLFDRLPGQLTMQRVWD